MPRSVSITTIAVLTSLMVTGRSSGTLHGLFVANADSMYQDWSASAIELHRCDRQWCRVPRRIDLSAAGLVVSNVGVAVDHHPDGAQLVHRSLELAGGRVRILGWDAGEHREPIGVLVHVLVTVHAPAEAAPTHALLCRPRPVRVARIALRGYPGDRDTPDPARPGLAHRAPHRRRPAVTKNRVMPGPARRGPCDVRPQSPYGHALRDRLTS